MFTFFIFFSFAPLRQVVQTLLSLPHQKRYQSRMFLKVFISGDFVFRSTCVPKAFARQVTRNFNLSGQQCNKNLHTSQVAPQAGAFLGFSSMKRLGVLLLPPGWGAGTSQGYPVLTSPIPIYTPRWREAQEHRAR